MIGDNSGIFEELRAERQELERMIKLAKDIIKEEVTLSSAPFLSLEEKEGKLQITGIALAEGVWKSVLYPAEEIEKSANRLIGKPLFVEHGLDEIFERKEVGRVKLAYYDKALKSIVFQAEVTDSRAISLVKDGTFPAVSCSTWVDKFPVNPDQSIGFNFNFNELSLVRTPACEKCFIFNVEELSKKMNQEKQTLNIQSSQLIKTEVKVMTEENEEVIEEIEEDEDLSETDKRLYAIVEVESREEIEELNREKKVKGVYYGYPYKGKKHEEYKCPEGQVWDKKTGKCVEAPKEELTGEEKYKCPEGHIWDEKEAKCVKAPKEETAKEEYKCPEGQVWDEKEKKCVEAKEELSDAEELLEDLALPKDYINFMKKCMKESKTMPIIKRMKECVKAFKAQKPEEKAKEEYKCEEGQKWDEKEKKCVPIEKEKYPAPEEKSSQEFTDMKSGPIKVIPGPAEQAEVIAGKEKLSAEIVKKEELPIVPKVETPMTEEPCKDCPKKEEEKTSEIKEPVPAIVPAVPIEPKVEEVKPVETPKTEEPKEEPKVETPKVEPPKEESKVEIPRTEEKKPEEPKKEEIPVEVKGPTLEETKAYFKEHPDELEKLLLKLLREKKFP